jgi:Icc-related predicted phosphoesterase
MKNGILVVGDIHGEWDRLNILINKKKPDIILQCGDFGWWPTLEVKKSRSSDPYYYQKAWKLKGVKSQGTKVYWCDGNHEDHYALERFTPDNPRTPIFLYDGVYYCPRGSVLELPDGRNVMFIGGADSIDKHLRTLGIDWFEEELISYEQQNFILDYTGKVDIVISHTCPEGLDPREKIFDHDKNDDPTGRILAEVQRVFKPKLWYHGHWHQYKKQEKDGTIFTSLDHCSHGGVWWEWLL